MQNNIVHLSVLALLLATQVQGALFPTNLLRTLWKNPKYIVKGFEAVSDACQAAEEACSAAQSQALAPITLQTTRTLTTPAYVTAYNPYVATIAYTPPTTPPQAPQLLGTAPNVVAPRLEKDKRQDAGATNIFPEIAAAWNWTLDAYQQAVLDSDSWLMWETNPLCFWSNMLAFYREAAADESSDSSSNDDIYAPPCDTNWGTGTAEFWTCVYQDLVLREIPSALAYVYYPRASLPLSSATCSVLGYSTATVMYYSSTPGPTQIGIETSSGGSTFATAGASDESSSDASVTSSSAARRLEATYSIADHALLGPLACSVVAILAIAAVL